MVTRSGPVQDEDSQPFWDGLARHELTILRCRACGRTRAAPRIPACPRCGADAADEDRATGRGAIYSWIVVRHPIGTITEDETPCTIVTVDLDEDCRMVGRLVDGTPDFERPVHARFMDHDGWTELAFTAEGAEP